MSDQDSYYNAGHHSQYQNNQVYYNPYTDERRPGENPNQDNNYFSAQREPTPSVTPVQRESSRFEHGEFPAAVAPPGRKNRSAQALRDYRYDHQGNLCTKGGRVRCIGRICCCSLMTTVFLLVSIVLALALWIRPPSITIGSVQPTLGSTGDGIQVTNGGLSVNLSVAISVSNPNYFSVDFSKINAEIFYPINNTAVGGGSASNIVFKSRSQTNFTFPFTLNYNSAEDPRGAIISDLANKCGVEGGTKSNLNIDYKITLGIRILLVTISPVISNQFNFPCPISASEISGLLGGAT